jgi:hypothetical protein
MSDAYELLYGFDPFYAADGTADTDFDGVSNADEEVYGTNPTIDDYAPIIISPESINVDANHTFTKLELSDLIAQTNISVSDGHDGENCCELIPLGFESGANNIPSGLYNINWRTEDQAGNIAIKAQTINVHPLVNLGHAQLSGEGATVRVNVLLSGDAPRYPLEIPFSITGDVDPLDYEVASEKIVITSGQSGYIDIKLHSDFESEADEELIITLKPSVNAGVNNRQVITITENNVAPTVTLNLTQALNLNQQSTNVAAIAKDSGEASISLAIEDVNPSDKHVINWTIPEYVNAEISANSKVVYIDPTKLALPEESHNLIQISVEITDNGEGELSQTKIFNIPVIEQRPRLTGTDTDRDGIADNIEGFNDADGDGLPDFMDSSSIAYLQQLHVNSAETKLMETEPGLQLRLGKYALQQFSDGVQMSQSDIDETQLIQPDTYDRRSDYFDFEIHNILPFGRSVYVVLPLEQGLPAFALYRKFSQENGWQDFVENANNTVSSAPMNNKVCPAPHDNAYEAGLVEGYECVRLMIEDGGANDADAIANGVVDDPGGIALVPIAEVAEQSDPESSSGGGSLSIFSVLLLFYISRLKRLKKAGI